MRGFDEGKDRPRGTDLAVRDLAARLGDEALSAAQDCDQYQETSARFFFAAAPTAELFEQAQELDRLSQRLRAIAAAIHRLADQAPLEWCVASRKVTQDIGLAEVAARLGGGIGHAGEWPPAPAGDLDLF